MKIWHTNSEVPELNKNVIANNRTPQSVTISNSTIRSKFISDEDLIRWRYSFEPNMWHTKEELPNIGNTVLGEYKSYRVWELVDGATQTKFINNTNIVRWCYWEDAINIKATPSGKVMTCIKEGEDNDWEATTNGYISLESDIKALKQQINSRIQTLPNEVDSFEGIDYLNIIFGNTTWAVKAQAIVEVIKNIPAVNNVSYVSALWRNKRDGEFQMTFVVDSIFGELNFNFGLNDKKKTIILN